MKHKPQEPEHEASKEPVTAGSSATAEENSWQDVDESAMNLGQRAFTATANALWSSTAEAVPPGDLPAYRYGSWHGLPHVEEMLHQRSGDREREGVSGAGAEVEGEVVYTVIV